MQSTKDARVLMEERMMYLSARQMSRDGLEHLSGNLPPLQEEPCPRHPQGGCTCPPVSAGGGTYGSLPAGNLYLSDRWIKRSRVCSCPACDVCCCVRVSGSRVPLLAIGQPRTRSDESAVSTLGADIGTGGGAGAGAGAGAGVGASNIRSGPLPGHTRSQSERRSRASAWLSQT